MLFVHQFEKYLTIYLFDLDIPLKIIITMIAGSLVLIATCIITITIKCKCKNNTKPSQGNFPHFDAGSIGPNYGYAPAKAHER